MLRLIFLAFSTLTLTAVHANSLDNGLLAYERGNYAVANQLLTPQAHAGSALAQFCLGYMNYMGVGVDQDQAQAAEWYKKAANQGLADAQYNLGYLYITGEGVERDLDQAITLLKAASDAGHTLAMYELGVLYEFGDGVTKDWAKARTAYQLAAADGFQLAQQAYTRVTAVEPRKEAEAQKNSLIAPSLPTSTPHNATYRLKVDRVNLRGGPGTKFDIVETLPQGALLRRLGTQGQWSHLHLQDEDDREGWLLTKFLERLDGVSAKPNRPPLATPREAAATTQPLRLFVKSREANMRETPSISAPIVARLSGGQPLELERREADWALVEIPVNTGFKGWVHKDLLAWPN